MVTRDASEPESQEQHVVRILRCSRRRGAAAAYLIMAGRAAAGGSYLLVFVPPPPFSPPPSVSPGRRVQAGECAWHDASIPCACPMRFFEGTGLADPPVRGAAADTPRYHFMNIFCARESSRFSRWFLSVGARGQYTPPPPRPLLHDPNASRSVG